MLKTLAYVDVTCPEDVQSPTEQQQAAMDTLPKFEQFCGDNSLSVRDMEVLVDMLRDKVNLTKLGRGGENG
jgi:hypothetical protein